MFQIFKQPWTAFVVGFTVAGTSINLSWGKAVTVTVLVILGIAIIGALAAFIESENHLGE